ncbi:MAG: DUF3599 family protein [Oscillospiraceae bacterium]
MSIEKMLDHTCDIYHIAESKTSPGYNLPLSPSFEYPKLPNISGTACHFGVNSNISIKQEEPQNVMEAKTKLTLPTGTDVRLNDKIVDCASGLEYTAEIPRNIRNHHIIVYVKKVVEQRAL